MSVVTTTQRPIGISIIAVLLAIGGILGILASIAILTVSPILGIISLVISIAQFVIAVGLWRLQKWAYWGAVVIEVLALLLDLLPLTNGGSVSWLGIIISVIVLIYLFADNNVRRAFGV